VRLIRRARQEKSGATYDADGMKCTTPVFFIPGPSFDHLRWYVVCFATGMLDMLTAPALTLLFLGVVVGLGTAVVWMLWEMEQATMSKPPRNIDRAG